MRELKHGRVSVHLPEELQLSARAGKMSKKEVSRLLKAPIGMKKAALDAATSLENVGPSFMAPLGITPESLRSLCTPESEVLEGVISDLLFWLLAVKQEKLLLDHQKYVELCRLKDQVRTQAKHDPEIARKFALFLELFEKSSNRRADNRAKKRKAEREAATPPELPSSPPLNLVKMPAATQESS